MNDREEHKEEKELVISIQGLHKSFEDNHVLNGIDLDVKWAKETMAALYRIWGRPVNVRTLVEGQKKLMIFDKGQFSEK